jgi:hypothetical protein
MGGGIIQRYAMSDEPQLADAYLLFAPLPGRGIPDERMPRFARPHWPRFLGTLMLNAVGIERFNHLPVLKFGLPEFEGHINQYTFTSTFDTELLKTVCRWRDVLIIAEGDSCPSHHACSVRATGTHFCSRLRLIYSGWSTVKSAR